MNFTVFEFSDITLAVFFLYIFFETKIYLAIWVALFHLLRMTTKLFFFDNITIYKVTIFVYVIVVLVGYLYKFRNILSSKDKPVTSKGLETLKTDKNKQRRIGIAFLLLMLINAAAVFIF